MPDFFDILSLRFSAVLPQSVAGLAVAGAFWLLARFVGSFIMRHGRHDSLLHSGISCQQAWTWLGLGLDLAWTWLGLAWLGLTGQQ